MKILIYNIRIDILFEGKFLPRRYQVIEGTFFLSNLYECHVAEGRMESRPRIKVVHPCFLGPVFRRT
jgi:hypothetical protein